MEPSYKTFADGHGRANVVKPAKQACRSGSILLLRACIEEQGGQIMSSEAVVGGSQAVVVCSGEKCTGACWLHVCERLLTPHLQASELGSVYA